MAMPGRNGKAATGGGWAQGTTKVNGVSISETLTIDTRTDNTPTEYKAATGIEFTDGFTSGSADEFVALIADATNTTTNGNGTGSNANAVSGYRYGFNGKEDDKDISEGGQDYGMRVYDARIGKFLSVDPLAKSYPWNSTYAFAENDVIRSIDLDGQEKLIYTFTNTNGTWTKTQIELPKAGPLGDGVLVKFKNANTEKYFYGSVMPDNTTANQFTMKYEEAKRNSKGEHVARTLPGESLPTIGYGHVAKNKVEEKKYANGKTIDESTAQALLEGDLAKTDVTFPNFKDRKLDIALSDFSFNTTNEASKTVDRWNSSDDKSNFFVSQIRARVKSVNTDLAKRRAAEQILFTFKKFVNIDYAGSEQKNWKSTYDKYVDENGKKKEESQSDNSQKQKAKS